MCLSGAMGLESAACACCEQTRTPQRASSAPRVVHTHPRPQPQPSPRAPSPPLPLPLTAAGAPPSSAPCNAQTPRCVRLCASRSPSWAASSQVGVTWVVTRAGAGAGAGTAAGTDAGGSAGAGAGADDAADVVAAAGRPRACDAHVAVLCARIAGGLWHAWRAWAGLTGRDDGRRRGAGFFGRDVAPLNGHGRTLAPGRALATRWHDATGRGWHARSQRWRAGTSICHISAHRAALSGRQVLLPRASLLARRGRIAGGRLRDERHPPWAQR